MLFSGYFLDFLVGTTQKTSQFLEQNFKAGILHLFTQYFTSTYLLSNGKYYEQNDGVVMGSSLAPTWTTYFKEDFQH
jgi:hypothetical protein